MKNEYYAIRAVEIVDGQQRTYFVPDHLSSHRDPLVLNSVNDARDSAKAYLLACGSHRSLKVEIVPMVKAGLLGRLFGIGPVGVGRPVMTMNLQEDFAA
jgi:hypothetical protein